jgi:hypothetical protein
MQWQVIVALVVMVPVILSPVAIIWLDIGGTFTSLKEVWDRRTAAGEKGK